MKAVHTALIALISAVWVGLVTGAVVYAQSSPVGLSVTPDVVTLAPGETAQAIVTAKISSTAVQSITLSAFSDAGVEVTINDPLQTQPPLRGDIAWKVLIKQANIGRSTGKVYFRADYQSKKSGDQLIPGVVMASVNIQEFVPDTIDKVITASLETALETLQDQQSHQVFVIVKNISNIPVTVTAIIPSTTPDICAEPEALGKGLRLEPQHSHPFPITLKAKDAVQPGKHLLVVQVDIEWEKANQHMNGSLVLYKDFKVGIFGESALLDATTIPSVMLIPGFLFVITLSGLVKFTWGKTCLDLDFKKPEFWFFAITISLLNILIYPKLTGLLLPSLLGRSVPPRDFLRGYGFNDILLFWFGAILAGVVFWVVGGVVVWTFVKTRMKVRYYWFVPAEDDSPLKILEKIRNNRYPRGINLQPVKYPGNNANAQNNVYVLPSSLTEAGKIWIAPRFGPRWRGRVEQQRQKELEEELEQRFTGTQDLDSLRRLLKDWKNQWEPEVELVWCSGPHVRQPQQVEQSQAPEVPGGDPFYMSLPQ